MVVQRRRRAAVPDVPRRRDAVRSHEVLLAAARELFVSRGLQVPLVEVARAAGVGQGTLYRHFRDRQALLVACAQAELAAFDERISAYAARPEPLTDLLRDAADRLARPPLLFALGGAATDDPTVRRLVRRRMRQGFDRVVARAVELGQVRADLTGGDVMLVFDLVVATLEVEAEPAERRERAARAIDVALTGLLRR